MAGKMMPEEFSFENTWANTKLYHFNMSIAQADGAECVIFYNTGGYARGFFRLWIQSSHGSLGWAHVSGQVSRYGLNYVDTSESMAYMNLSYHQNASNVLHNGIKVVRTGTYGTATSSIHGYFIAPGGAGCTLAQSISGTNTINHAYFLSKGV